MKREYVKPMMVGEVFAANEYCSTCSATQNKYYKFVCDAGGGAYVDIYEGEYPSGENLTDGLLSYFHACSVEHYVLESEANFTKGQYDANTGSWKDYRFDVVIWKGEANDNVHATKSLQEDIQIVEGNKS